MVSKDLLKTIIFEQTEMREKLEFGIQREKLDELKPVFKLPHTIIIAGIRRTGKSTLLRQIMDRYYKNKCYYFHFEDERLLNFSKEDFNTLYEVFLEIYDEKKIFFLDEIQNIEGWEHFVRRMQENGFKFFISGSNAKLLSRELGTKLTGRHISATLYPFSFKEFLKTEKYEINENDLLKTKMRAKIRRLFLKYLKMGGMPEYIKFKNPLILKAVYEDILYKDIIVRHDVKESKSLRELGLYYISNIGSPVSFHKLKTNLRLGSTNTVKAYTEYFENSFLFFTLRRFSWSLKQQYIAAKKIYCIDNGLAGEIAFSFSENKEKFLENMVFIELKRKNKEIFYYKTKRDREIDFAILEKGKPQTLLQVCWDLHNPKTKSRELDALTEGLSEIPGTEGIILTMDEKEKINFSQKSINVIPVWEWLLK